MKINSCQLALIVVFGFLSADCALATGDRALKINCVYPAPAFASAGGRVIDITHPPTGITAATGNGSTDDTAAFVSAYDYIKAQAVSSGGVASYIIYLPNGTYRVTNTLFYSGSVAQVPFSGGKYDINHVHFVGQSRSGTIIKLDDNCPGFTAAATPKAVLRYSHPTTVNNGIPAANVCQNLTINTGTGNLGAIGIQFQSANSGMISNVAVTSADYKGVYGIWISTGSLCAYLHDIVVTGFNSGIYSQAALDNSGAWEHLTCVGQNVAAVTIADGGVVLRDLFSRQNRAPAYMVNFTQHGGNCVLIDSRGDCIPTTNPAISLTDSQGEGLFVRNTLTHGYGAAIKTGAVISVAGPYISEYKSFAATTLFTPQDTHSFAMAVKESPTTKWVSDLSQWLNVEDYRLTGYNDNQTVQAAFAAAAALGKPVVYFPKLTYSLTQSVNVPANVTRIETFCGNHLGNYVSPGLFNVNAPSSSPLIVAGANALGTLINIAAKRTVVDLVGSGDIANAQTAPVETYIESSTNVGGNVATFCSPNQSVWARAINSEYQFAPDLQTNGGRFWILGCKTEDKATTAVNATNGGYMEVFGAYINTVNDGTGVTSLPMLKNNNSSLCFNGFTGNYYPIYTTAITEIDGTTTSTKAFNTFPLRLSPNTSTVYNNPGSIDISLYVGGERPQGPYGVFTIGQDIGAVAAGGSSINTSNKTYTLDASGSNIGGVTDSFHFLNKDKSGDSTITVQIMAVDNTNAGAKAGVMFRDGLAANAMFVDVTASAAQGLLFEARTATGAASQTLATAGTFKTPCWVRLTRSGNTFTAASSQSGAVWRPFGSPVAVPLPTSVKAGLCATAHSNTGMLCRAILNRPSLQ